MKVRMISGTYGYRNKNGHLETKDAKSAPFELEEEEAVRLINMGRAVEILSTETAPQPGMMKAHLEPTQFEDMDKKELVKLAKEMGLPSSGSKEELIARITAAEVEITESDDEDTDGNADNSEVPDLKPAEPEV